MLAMTQKIHSSPHSVVIGDIQVVFHILKPCYIGDGVTS